ncbi:MAG: DUF2085 domain-containing protein [Chloroflexales bacterium]|nr:DUF2085 domain-containing protein [Chloroflexales bacterium]
MATALALHEPSAPQVWPRWPLDALLWVLFLGPVIAPLFQVTGLPLAASAGMLARDLLAAYVCPTPDRSIRLLGLPVAVCARCWGATIGLWAARWLAGRARAEYSAAAPLQPLGWFRGLPWPARLLLATSLWPEMWPQQP